MASRRPASRARVRAANRGHAANAAVPLFCDRLVGEADPVPQTSRPPPNFGNKGIRRRCASTARPGFAAPRSAPPRARGKTHKAGERGHLLPSSQRMKSTAVGRRYPNASPQRRPPKPCSRRPLRVKTRPGRAGRRCGHVRRYAPRKRLTTISGLHVAMGQKQS